MKLKLHIALFSIFLMFGCGDSGGSGDSSGGNGIFGYGAGCKSSDDCNNSDLCIRIGNSSSCKPSCSVNANECGGSAECSAIGGVSVNYCEEKKEEKKEETPKAEEQPKISCTTDADCEKLQSGAICAQFKGVKDCTIKCSSESDCDPPELAGMKLDFLTCIPDESDSSRTACLPDEKCFTNPSSCMSGLGGTDPFGGDSSCGMTSGGTTGGLPGMP